MRKKICFMSKSMPNSRLYKGVMILVLFVAMSVNILQMFPTFSVEAEQVTGLSQAEPAEGVYEISSTQEMKAFVTQVNNGNNFQGITVRLTKDIAFDGVTVDNYTPAYGFAGTFDGCGYSISGVLVSCSASCHGIFGSITSTAVVKNITIKNSTFDLGNDGDILGAIVGHNDGGLVINCHAYNVAVISNQSKDIVGGIVGLNEGTVKNCTFAGGSVKAYNCAGGIVGQGGYIYNCGNMGTVSSTGISTYSYGNVYGAGGVAGKAYSIQNCYNTGTVSCADTDSYCGGIAGSTSYVVANCYYLDTSCSVGIASAERPSSTNKALTDAYMRSADFVKLLNTNRGDNSDWLVWELRSESLYPVPVKPINISTLSVALASGAIIYDGTQKQPAVSVTREGVTLKPDTDYTVKYVNNINAGTATLYVYGQNMYCGIVAMDFAIEKAAPKLQYKKTYTKTYGAAGFNLNISVLEGESDEVKYKSSNPKVAVVHSNGDVSLVNTGKATITVTIPETENYKAVNVKISITVKPKTPSVSLQSKNKRLTIKWKKISKATGYELQYSTNSSFKKGVKTVKISAVKTVSKTIKGLKKGKKYYVRVRAYKTVKVNGKSTKIYSSWSTKKSIKIK